MPAVSHEIFLNGSLSAVETMPSTSRAMTNLTPGQTYSVQIRGVNDDGTRGPLSTPISVTMATLSFTPVLNAATNITAYGFDISCQASANATTYEFQIGGVTVQNTASRTYTGPAARGLPEETQYTCRVRAITNTAVPPESAWSPELTVTTLAVSPPTGLQASGLSSSSIRIAWDDMGGANYRLTADGTEIYSGANTTYDHTGLGAVESYLYVVEAINPATGTRSNASQGAIGTTIA